jgi:plasmid stability protein
MATLYVEHIPDDLYDAIRGRARSRRRSIAAEVLALLEENFPTARELKARKGLLQKLGQMRSEKLSSREPFHSTEEMLREDRER